MHCYDIYVYIYIDLFQSFGISKEQMRTLLP